MKWSMTDSALFLVSSGFQIGSFSKDDGEGNEKLRKAIGSDLQNNTFSRVSLFFVRFFAITARPARENA